MFVSKQRHTELKFLFSILLNKTPGVWIQTKRSSYFLTIFMLKSTQHLSFVDEVAELLNISNNSAYQRLPLTMLTRLMQ